MPTNTQYKNKTSPQRIAAKERRTVALKLRLAGLQFKEIGRQLGCSRQRAAQLVMGEIAIIAEQNAELAAQVRDIELVRIDAIQSGIWGQATTGHLGCIDRVIRLMERRAKLLGLDAPEQIELGGQRGTTMAEMFALAQNPEAYGDLSGLPSRLPLEATERPADLPDGAQYVHGPDGNTDAAEDTAAEE